MIRGIGRGRTKDKNAENKIITKCDGDTTQDISERIKKMAIGRGRSANKAVVNSNQTMATSPSPGLFNGKNLSRKSRILSTAKLNGASNFFDKPCSTSEIRPTVKNKIPLGGESCFNFSQHEPISDHKEARRPMGVKELCDGKHMLDASAVLIFAKEMYSKQASDKLFYALLNSLNFKKETRHGSSHHVAIFASTTSNDHLAFSTNRYVLQIKEDLENKSGLQFNTCYVNLLRDNNDFVGFFSSGISESGRFDPNVGFVCFGDSRRLELSRRDEKSKSADFYCHLGHGSSVITKADVERRWLYNLPRELHPKSPFVLLFFTNRTMLL